MSYRIFWGRPRDDVVVEGAGVDRGEVEALLGQAWPQASWAEVFDEHGVAVAHQSSGRLGLTGFPGAHGWGHLCVACRVQVGQNYRYVPAHARLRRNPAAHGHPSYICRNCGSEMGREFKEPAGPADWHVLAWPDMKS